MTSWPAIIKIVPAEGGLVVRLIADEGPAAGKVMFQSPRTFASPDIETDTLPPALIAYVEAGIVNGFCTDENKDK